MQKHKFWAVLTPGGLSAVQAIDLLTTARGPSEAQAGELLPNIERVKASVRRCSEHALPVTLNGLELDFAKVNHCNLAWLSITGKELQAEFLDTLASELFLTGTLVMAVLLNHDYDYWQNAEDLLQYRAAGRAYAHLRLRSNGLPAPLTQDVVDISENPGRRYLREGFIEVVGSRMWLTDLFWTLTGADKRILTTQHNFHVRQEASGLLKLEASITPFDSPEGEQASTQNRLREMLFPSAPEV